MYDRKISCTRETIKKCFIENIKGTVINVLTILAHPL